MKRCLSILLSLLLAMPTALRAQSDFYVLDMRSGLPESRIRALCQMPDGRMAIATAGTICIYDGTRFQVSELNPKHEYHLNDYRGFRHLVCDSTGLVWLRNNGSLYVLDAHRQQLIANVDSLLAARHLTAEQVSRWPVSEAWRSGDDFARVSSLVDEEISAIVRDSYGGLWVGLKESGILYSNPARKRQFRTTEAAFPFEALYPFCSPRASQLSTKFAASATNCTLDGRTMAYTYLGTRWGVVIVDREDHVVATLDEHDGLSKNNVVALLSDRRGDVWAATADGLTRIRQAGCDSFDIVNYGLLDGIDTRGREIRTCQMHLDSAGLVTVGFVGGTIVFHPDSVQAPRYTFHYPRTWRIADTTTAVNYWWLVMLGVVGGLIVVSVLWRKSHLRQPRDTGKPFTNQTVVGQSAVGEALSQNIAQQAVEQHLSSGELEFLDRLKTVIEQHVGDEDFSVQSLSEMMAMDRTVLYRRMQTLTGMPPSVYVKNIRMDIACRLLLETDRSVTDIAMKTGFATTKYFSAAFKEAYGMTPNEFRKQRH